MNTDDLEALDVVRQSTPSSHGLGQRTASVIVNKCPFGCTDAESYVYGQSMYCKHVVGFTDGEKSPDDGRIVYEKMAFRNCGTALRLVTGEQREERLPGGAAQEYAISRKVQPGDVVIQMHNGDFRPKKLVGTQWARVYRPLPGDPLRVPQATRTAASDSTLLDRLAADMERMKEARKADQEEIKRLKEAVGEVA